MRKEDLLRLLREHPNRFISGEELSTRLQVTRAAVWKAVDALRREGYVISSGTNKGYRLEKGPGNLTAGELKSLLHTRIVGSEIICLESVDSTNTYLKRLAESGAADGTVVIAREQVGGRGRLGRTFQSPADKGLYLSFLMRPSLPPERLLRLTGMVAVAVCDAVEQAFSFRPGIKWVNDLVAAGKKLCGILTELSLEAQTGEVDYVVTGLGLNLKEASEEFSPEVRKNAVSLSEVIGRPADALTAAASILQALDRMYEDLNAERGEYAKRYREGCVTIGHEVRILRGDGNECGFAETVDDDLGLVGRFPDGSRETLRSGEVSVRGMDGYL